MHSAGEVSFESNVTAIQATLDGVGAMRNSTPPLSTKTIGDLELSSDFGVEAFLGWIRCRNVAKSPLFGGLVFDPSRCFIMISALPKGASKTRPILR